MAEGHKLVYGLGGGLVYSSGANGTWPTVITKLLNTFDNAVLISTVDMSYKAAKVIYEAVGTDRLYLDSGGYTLFKRQMKLGADSPEFHHECEKMKKKFLTLCGQVKPCEVFELDNDYFKKNDDLLSPDNFCRKEAKEILGFYPTPVFKMHQGYEYWKALCESDIYPKLAIGGLAQTNSWDLHAEELTKMMNYARACGKKVHLLGCQNAETFRMVHPSTVDYSIFQYYINLKKARLEHPELKTYAELKQQIVLYAFARAKGRSFLYDNECEILHEGEDFNEDEENEEEK